MADPSLLTAENDFLNKLLFENLENAEQPKQNTAASGITVVPKPGFCLKTKLESGEKVFINVCIAENVPAPKDISDAELLRLVDSDDSTGFRIPMSLGEPHAELDKGGNGCAAYDVVINTKFLKRVQESELLRGFFLTIILEGLESKYNITLSREWRLLKNRKFVGSLPEQQIRQQSKPWIMEMDSAETKSQTAPPKPKGREPAYTILQEPAEGHPDFLVAELHLPQLKSAASLTLDIGEDRILLQTRAGVYYLDIYLPFLLVQEECASQFNRKTKILTVTMPVVPILPGFS